MENLVKQIENKIVLENDIIRNLGYAMSKLQDSNLPESDMNDIHKFSNAYPKSTVELAIDHIAHYGKTLVSLLNKSSDEFDLEVLVHVGQTAVYEMLYDMRTIGIPTDKVEISKEDDAKFANLLISSLIDIVFNEMPEMSYEMQLELVAFKYMTLYVSTCDAFDIEPEALGLDELTMKNNAVLEYCIENLDMNDAQVQELRKGIEDGVDISLYAKEMLSWSQMVLIREGLVEGLDVTLYNDPQFNYKQMIELSRGLKLKLDIRSLCNPDFTWEQMNAYIDAMSEGLDISSIISKDYDYSQILVLKNGIKHKVNILPLLDPRYTSGHMEEILMGLIQGLDVSPYANPLFSTYQMSLIRYGLLIGLDPKWFANPEFSGRQISVIMKDLHDGKDVSYYAKPGLKYNDMMRLREQQEWEV